MGDFGKGESSEDVITLGSLAIFLKLGINQKKNLIVSQN